jgi:hypothetical protein
VIKYIGGEGAAKTSIIIKKNKTLTLIKIRLLDEISKNNTNNIGDLIFTLEGYAPTFLDTPMVIPSRFSPTIT